MLYSLPNGKVISISVAEYLDMTDDDLKAVNGLNIGGSSANPFQSLDGQADEDDEDTEPNHQTLEFLSDEDEPSTEIDLNALFDSDETPLI
jgi:hypothetical protein